MSASFDRAVFLFNCHRCDLAERELRRAIAEDPGHAPSHAFLGMCLARLKRGSEAFAAAEEAIRLDPGLAFVHFAMANVQVGVRGRRGFERAKGSISEAIRLDPGSPNYYFLLSAILSDQWRAKQSLEQAESGLRQDPQHAGCASLRALALQRLGRKQEAEEVIATALALDPDGDFTQTAQGWRLMQQGDIRRAREHFREALRIDPTNRWAQNGLGATRWLAPRTIRGRDVFKVLAVIAAVLLVAAIFGGGFVPRSTVAIVAITLIPQVGLATLACAALDRLRAR